MRGPFKKEKKEKKFCKPAVNTHAAPTFSGHQGHGILGQLLSVCGVCRFQLKGLIPK